MFPLLLYLAVRQMEFRYIDGMSNTVWIQLEILQLAIAGCAEIVITSTGHMLALEKERNELLKKEMLFEKRQQQYLIQKETIEAVNRKYHDLKHYIAGFEAMDLKNTKDMEDYLGALKQEIEPFECIQKTGNEVMDLLLFERIQECQKKGIRLVPFVDGRCLSFLHTMDLCAIFGNAMDNAIEATERVRYVNMREISVKIGVSDCMLIMRFQNYYDGTLLRQGDRLLSSKEEKQDHGYGLENIQRIAEKYGGTVASDADEQEFSLHILIPLPQDAGTT
jgi:sensor histidine kinase regulating citrate/malate metabolism